MGKVKLCRTEKVNIFTLILAFAAAAFCTVFLVGSSIDTAKQIIKHRQNPDMYGHIYVLFHFCMCVGDAMFFLIPLTLGALSSPNFNKRSGFKSIRVLCRVVFYYSLCGILACIIVLFGLPRWV